LSNVSIVIADKSYIVRKGLSAMLEEINGVKVTMNTGSPRELKHILSAMTCDLLFLGTSMLSDMDTLLKGSGTNMYQRNVVLVQSGSTSADANLFLDVISIDQDKKELLGTLDRLVRLFLNEEEGEEPLELTEREKNIVELVARGLTNKDIAEKLHISLHTVITHRKNISQKLGIRSISGLTVFAILNDIVSIKDLNS
jgi:DNA-binding NarL/FixJ family response regulator